LEEVMRHSVRASVIGAAVAAMVLVSGGIAVAASNGDSGHEEAQTPISGSELERASAAALASTGGGTVSETEVGDEDSYYEVEVTRDNGTHIDVQLDESFQVVATMPDSAK
jgi:uncharacterized membrane protein YkoI